MTGEASRPVRVLGELVCRSDDEAAIVREYLPRHIRLTRAEPGCIEFEVTATSDPLLWRVEERFDGPESFTAHQDRVADSEWGRVTRGIQRRYDVGGHPPG